MGLRFIYTLIMVFIMPTITIGYKTDMKLVPRDEYYNRCVKNWQHEFLNAKFIENDKILHKFCHNSFEFFGYIGCNNECNNHSRFRNRLCFINCLEVNGINSSNIVDDGDEILYT